ncbi:hypothetical protein [Gracilibacillus sp. JCM 18860]|uniref:hypothetical protein n=1 Tax=Gracilibacillus sp. JCM 18860 TaxID=1306159 RepID=UPI0006D0D7F7
MDYLIGCQLGFAYEKNIPKPSIEATNRCFHRHLAQLRKVFDINDYKVNQYPNKIVRDQYKVSRHYLFKFSQNGWYRNLPDEILTLDNKYPSTDIRENARMQLKR